MTDLHYDKDATSWIVTHTVSDDLGCHQTELEFQVELPQGVAIPTDTEDLWYCDGDIIGEQFHLTEIQDPQGTTIWRASREEHIRRLIVADRQADADAFHELLEACRNVVARWESGDLAEAARMCAAAIETATGVPALAAPQADRPQLLIIVEGGVVQGLASDQPERFAFADVKVVDFDTDGLDSCTSVAHEDGTTEAAVVADQEIGRCTFKLQPGVKADSSQE